MVTLPAITGQTTIPIKCPNTGQTLILVKHRSNTSAPAEHWSGADADPHGRAGGGGHAGGAALALRVGTLSPSAIFDLSNMTPVKYDHHSTAVKHWSNTGNQVRPLFDPLAARVKYFDQMLVRYPPRHSRPSAIFDQMLVKYRGWSSIFPFRPLTLPPFSQMLVKYY